MYNPYQYSTANFSGIFHLHIMKYFQTPIVYICLSDQRLFSSFNWIRQTFSQSNLFYEERKLIQSVQMTRLIISNCTTVMDMAFICGSLKFADIHN